MQSTLAPISGTPYVDGNVPGDLAVTAAGLQHVRKHNLASASDPTVTDDSVAGYEVGSTILTTAGKFWICTSAAVGAATWVDLSAATAPAGTGTEIQYRSSATAFGAVAGSSFSGTVLTLPTIAANVGIGAIAFTPADYLQGVDGVVVRGTYAGISQSTSAGFWLSYRLSRNLTWASSTDELGTTSFRRVFTLSPDYSATIGNGTTSATPTDGYLRGTGGSGTNVVGGNLVIAPGPSTGSATPSSVIIQSAVAGTSGSTAQTLADTLTVTNGLIGIGAPPTFFPLTVQQALDSKLFLCSGSGVAEIVLSNTGTPASAAAARKGVISFGTQSGSERYIAVSALNAGAGLAEVLRIRGSGAIGVNTSAANKAAEINSVTGDCLRLTYNDSNGSATHYTDITVSAAGNLTITPSGGVVDVTGDMRPATDDTYYIGKNDDDTPAAWKGVILKDTTNGKYYRIEVVNGTITATDLTD